MSHRNRLLGRISPKCLEGLLRGFIQCIHSRCLWMTTRIPPADTDESEDLVFFGGKLRHVDLGVPFQRKYIIGEG